jgi:hypothetical protein
MLFATVLAKVAQPSVYVYASLYPWARPPVGSLGKLSSLLQYILPVLALFIHYAIFLWASKFFTNSLVGIDKEKLNKIGFYFLVAVVINGTLLFIGKEQKLILGVLSALWAIIYLWTPYAVFRNRQVHSYKFTWFWAVVLCVISIQYVATFVPLIIKPIQLSNDYINISCVFLPKRATQNNCKKATYNSTKEATHNSRRKATADIESGSGFFYADYSAVRVSKCVAYA